MRNTRWLMLLGVIVAGVSVLLFAAACGDDEGDGGETPTAEATTPPAGETPTVVETPAEGVVNVDLNEWTVSPDPASAAVGSVTFNAANSGTEDHELVIIVTDLSPEALPAKADGSVDEEGAGIEVIDEIEEFAVGTSESLTVDLAAGNYVLICNVVMEMEDGETHVHYAEGMHAAFTVTD